jgi:hypothetical protein
MNGSTPFTPPMWKSGRPESQMSPGRASISIDQLIVFATRFWCVSIAPFGRPVVPDVYIRNARSSSSTSTSGASAEPLASSSS